MRSELRRVASVTVPLVALVGVLMFIPAEPAPVPKSAEVQSTQRLVCPALPNESGTLRVVGDGAGNLLSGSIGETQTTTPLGDVVLQDVTQSQLLSTDDYSGKLAAGFSLSGDRRQIWGACSPASNQQTLVFTSDGGTVLRLVNPTPVVTMVNVTIDTPDGDQPAPELLDVRLPANSTTDIELGGLENSDGVKSIRIQATDGQFSAYAVRTFDPGAEIITPSATGQDLIIPVAPGGARETKLILSNQSATRTTASISVIGAEGTFVPDGGTEFTVEAGRTREIDLTAVILSNPVAIRITSKDPISATLESWVGNDYAAIPSELISGNLRTRQLSVPVSGAGKVVLANPLLTEIDVVLRWDGAAGNAVEKTIPAGSIITVDIPEEATTLRVSHQDQVIGGLIIGGEESGLAVAPLQKHDVVTSSIPIRVEPRLGSGR